MLQKVIGGLHFVNNSLAEQPASQNGVAVQHSGAACGKPIRAGHKQQGWRKRTLLFIRCCQNIHVALGTNIRDIVYTKFLPAREDQKNTGQLFRDTGKYTGSAAGDGYAVLFMLFNTFVHRVYKRRASYRGHLFFFDIFAPGRFGVGYPACRHIQLEDCNSLRGGRADTCGYRRNHYKQAEAGKVRGVLCFWQFDAGGTAGTACP